MKNLIKNKIGKMAVIAMVVLGLSSCKKNETTINRSTATEFKAIQDAALNDLKQTATFDASTGTTFTSTRGTRLIIPPNALTKGGVPVTGNVTLEFTEIYDGGNMVVTNKPTMGILPDGNQSILISGGEFNINVIQAGQVLTLIHPMQLKVPINLTDSVANDMNLFNGVINAKGDLAWEKNPNVDVINAVDSNLVAPTEYQTLVNQFGWTNIDRFASDPRPKTTMQVSVPEGYNYDNCALYLKYVGLGSALAKLDTYDASNKLFKEHYGQIPIGLECYLIFCTQESGKWKYAIKPITITAGTTYTITEAEMTVASKADYAGHVTLLR